MSHTLHTTIPLGEGEIDVAITFDYVPGAPATGPTYDSGGEPGYGPEISFVSAERLHNGEPHPMCGNIEHRWLQEFCADWLADDGYDEAAEQAEQDGRPDPDYARDVAIEDRMIERHSRVMSDVCTSCGGPKGGIGIPIYGDPRCMACIRTDDAAAGKTTFQGTTRPLSAAEMKSIEPKTLPVDAAAAALGLPAGMKIDDYGNGNWRCSGCDKMQTDPRGVYISDRIRKGDSLIEIDGKMKRGYWSGGGSKWCIPCVQKLCNVPARQRLKKPAPVAARSMSASDIGVKADDDHIAVMRLDDGSWIPPLVMGLGVGVAFLVLGMLAR